MAIRLNNLKPGDKRVLKKYDPVVLKRQRKEGKTVKTLARIHGRSENTIRDWLDAEKLPRKLNYRDNTQIITVMTRNSEMLGQKFLSMALV